MVRKDRRSEKGVISISAIRNKQSRNLPSRVHYI
jgi:hypothetical protein